MISRSRALFAAITCFALLPGCADKKSTSLVVAVSSEVSVPEEVNELEITVTSGRDPRFNQKYKLAVTGRQASLPGTITLFPDGDTTSPFTVTVSARLDDGQFRVVRKATIGFSEEKTKLLRMPLRFSCLDFPKTCADTETCRQGECVPADTEADSLPEFTEQQVFGTVGDGHCFDRNACVPASSVVDITALFRASTDEEHCTIDVAQLKGAGTAGAAGAGGGGAGAGGGSDAGGAGGSSAAGAGQGGASQGGAGQAGASQGGAGQGGAGQSGAGQSGAAGAPASGSGRAFGSEALNVGVVWAKNKTKKWTAVDFDPEEGWQFSDAAHTKIHVARGLCQAIKGTLKAADGSSLIVKAIANPTCPPKLPTQPECSAPAAAVGGTAGAAGTGGKSASETGGTAGAGTSKGGTAGMAQ